MKDWSYGINSLYKTGHIMLDETPWYVFAIARAVEWMCDHMPAIPLPSDPIKDEDGNDTTLKEYYGDTSHLFHAFVHDPVFQWAEKQKKTTAMELSHKKVREIFYESDSKFFDDEEKIGKEIKGCDKNKEE